MHRLLKLIRRVKASERPAVVIVRAGVRDIEWYFADNVAEKRLKKSR